MRISADISVHRDQRAAVKAGGGDDDLVGRVLVKGARQLRGLNCNLGRQIQQAYAGISERLRQPLPDGQRKDQPSFH